MASQRNSQRKAVANRAPTTLLAGLTTRRSSQQVAADANAAAEAARKADAEAQAHQAQVMKTIGRLEDEVRREELQRKKNAARPDLHEKAPAPSKKKPQTSKLVAKKTEEAEPSEGEVDARPLKPTVLPRRRSSTNQSKDDFLNGEDDDSIGDATAKCQRSLLSDDDDKIAPIDEQGMESDGAVELPADSSVYDESGSDGFLLGEDEDDEDRGDDSDFQDGDGSDDDDFEEEEEMDWAAEKDQGKMASKKPKPKEKSKPKKISKAEKGAKFRQGVNVHRNTVAPAALTQATANQLKRQPEEGVGEPRSKKQKQELPSGLLKSFKNAHKKSSTSSHQPPSEPSSDIELEYNDGEYDRDEDEKTLLSVRNSKADVKPDGNEWKMSVNVSENASSHNGRSLSVAATSSANGRNFTKAECTWAHMPFDGLHAARCKELWRSIIKACLAAWAGTLEDPFAAATDLHTEVKKLWKLVLDGLSPLESGDLRWEIVEGVASTHLYTWRSEIGRAGLHVVVGTLRLELKDELEAGDGVEAGQRAAKYLLGGMRFLYGNPDAKKGESARPFESPLIVRTYFTHLRHVQHCLKKSKYPLGNPVGAVGLCAAAVERALKLVRDGSISIDVFPPVTVPPQEASARGTGKRRKSTVAAFTEKAWGGPTVGYIQAAKKLTDDHWVGFLELAKSITPNALEAVSDDEGNAADSEDDMRSNIRL